MRVFWYGESYDKQTKKGFHLMRKDIDLRVFEKDDLEFMHRLNNDPDVMDYWFEEPYMSMEKLKRRYEQGFEDMSSRQFILTNNGERLGFVALYSISQQHRNAEFGIMMDPAHQGKGYAKMGTKLILEYAFMRLNLHKIHLIVAKENRKAVHVYEKVGFQVEGELAEHFFVNGSYHNALSMAFMKRNYIRQ